MDQGQRLVLAVAYNGAPFKGWQKQLDPQLPTVQSVLEYALSKVADHPITVYCAGRTDAGVHASCQVVHCQPQVQRPLRAWVQGVNSHLPADIRVKWAQQTKDADFHARFSATARSYRYIIHNVAVASAHLQHLMTTVMTPLDVTQMNIAAQYLLGEQDFTSFRASGCQSNSPFRCVHAIQVHRHGSLVFLDIKANAFLLHMVRNITGMLIAVGSGKYPAKKVQQVLSLKDRRQADITAPPNGLYLVAVDYPDEFGLKPTFYLPEIYYLDQSEFLGNSSSQ